MLYSVQVGPLIDYIIHIKKEKTDFAIKGKPVLAMIAAMKKWHDELAIEKRLKGITYKPSGIKPGVL
jgi:hypothetical protein